MKLDHTKDLQVISYSAEIKTVTHPSSLVCEGVGIYANEYCQGEADEVVAWEYDEVTTQSKCFKSLPFHDTKYISMKLFCQEDPAGYDGDDDAETVAELAKQKAAAAAGGQS
ncbi:hypothetical protein BDV59DRAFT_173229 [Aspergillus ambiguus]|uniref:uncharacterized protein n=1 Tax=Aspergillus ambiguus TaxID=176160 RepID=UPI003CCC9334